MCPAGLGFVIHRDVQNQDDDRKNIASETEVTHITVFRPPSSCSSDSAESQRPAAESMMNHAESARRALLTLKPGKVVTKKNAQVNLPVVRNPELWLHGDVDGGAGKPGIISAIDEATETCTVYWYESGQVHDCSIGKRGVLCKPCVPGSLGGDDGLASVGMARSTVETMRALFGGCGRRGRQTTTPVEPFARQTSPFARQSSYAQYAERAQTAIIFDWDDTLFPTTYVRHDLGLSIKQCLKDQQLEPRTLSRVQAALAKAAGAADQLLRLADKNGKVIIVTLAKSPWVTDSCRYFFPGIGELIKQLRIQVVYAQEGEQIEYNRVNMMANDQFETFWAETKGKAISKALGEFYSRYEGQSWKNVISLGDSHFERYGTMAATMQYAEARGLVSAEGEEGRKGASGMSSSGGGGGGHSPEYDNDDEHPGARRGSVGSKLSVSSVKRHEDAGRRRRMSWEGAIDGHEVKVRTKTLKMLEEPTVDEFVVELSLLHRWLPLMVRLDDGFDIDFSSLGDAEIHEIERTLRAPGC